jgi:hypothetical protein
VVSSFLIDILFFDEIANIDLLRLFKLILFLLLNVLLNHSIDLTRSHAFLYFFRKLVENALVLYRNSQQCLLKFLVCESDCIILMVLLIFGEVSENSGHFLTRNDERVQLENQTEVVP